MKKYCLGIMLLLILILTTGCKKSIVGKWKSIDAKSEYYYLFNEDNTCSYEMKVARLDCTYEEDDERLIILFNGNDKARIYKYRFERSNPFQKNILVIIDDTGKDNRFILEK